MTTYTHRTHTDWRDTSDPDVIAALRAEHCAVPHSTYGAACYVDDEPWPCVVAQLISTLDTVERMEPMDWGLVKDAAARKANARSTRYGTLEHTHERGAQE